MRVLAPEGQSYFGVGGANLMTCFTASAWRAPNTGWAVEEASDFHITSELSLAESVVNCK
jgi:hypothetical protein